MDRIIRFINLAMFKISHLITSYGGLSIASLSMAYAIAFIDGMTFAKFTSKNAVTKMMVENPGVTIEQAKLMAYSHTEVVASLVIFIVAAFAFYFRITPSKNPKKPLKTVSIVIGIFLALVGIIGMVHSAVENSQVHTLAEIFSSGKILMEIAFSSFIACIPAIIIESIAAHIDHEHGEKLKEVSDADHETITESVKNSLSKVGQKRQKTTILQFPATAKTGTNGI